MLAPKLSVLQKAFSKKDLTVIALYIETCDGVPDHAAELRRQIAKHKIDYPALDAEAGALRDPTRKYFSGAPHAVIVSRRGRIVRAYAHMPRMPSLREDLGELIATGVFPTQPHDGWMEFPWKAWVEVQIRGGGPTRTERRTVSSAGAGGASIRVGKKYVSFRRESSAGRTRTEREPETLTVDGREVKARVFDATWKRLEMTFAERRWIAQGVVVRREVVESCPDGSKVVRSERLVKWRDPLAVGARTVACRVFEKTITWSEGRTDIRVWMSREVPGHEVKRVRRTGTVTETATVVAFGLR